MLLLRFSWLRWLGSVVLLAGIVLCSLPASAASHHPATHKPSVVGKWHLTVTFPDGHRESSVALFNQNGVLVNLTPGPGGGKWWLAGDDGSTFCYVFSEVFFTTSGVYSTLVEVKQQGKLSVDGKTYTAEGTGSVYDAATGNLIVVNHTTTLATRA